MFCEIYPQSVAHITTINECSTILQFTDPRSLVLDPQSRFPIFDSRSRLSSIKQNGKEMMTVIARCIERPRTKLSKT